MTDIIVIAVIIAIVGSASAYIYRQKKKGVRCVGCCSGGSCAGCAQGFADGGDK